MSKVLIDNITITNPKTSIKDHINFNITFTALDKLIYPLLWKVIYVGSAFTEDYDQILQEFQIGQINEASTLSFEVDCPPPDFDKIPREELICTTAMIVSIAYKGQQFIRIGYYIHNLYLGEVEDISKLSLQEIVNNSERTVIREKPRITKFQIKWDEGKNQQDKDEKEKVQINKDNADKVTEENLEKQKATQEREGQQGESACKKTDE